MYSSANGAYRACMDKSWIEWSLFAWAAAILVTFGSSMLDWATIAWWLAKYYLFGPVA